MSGVVVKDCSVPKRVRQVISPTVARQQLNPMMIKVVNEGTGKASRLAEYQVAGKTGTAQKLEGNVYSHSKFVSSFVGYAPANAPQVVVLVMMNEPKNGAYYGGTVAAPAVGQIIRRTLNYMNVEPCYVQSARL